MAGTSWRDILTAATQDRHIVQFYREFSFMRTRVAAWLGPALRSGGGALVLCTPDNAARVRQELAAEGLDVAGLERLGRLRIEDAQATLSRFMVHGHPNAARFKAAARRLLGEVKAACADPSDVRAWGEMVNVLWRRGETVAAHELEALWEKVIDQEGLRLLCSYDLEGRNEVSTSALARDACATHSLLIPASDYSKFEAAVSRSLVELFGDAGTASIRALFSGQQDSAIGMPPAEAVLVAFNEMSPELGKRLVFGAKMHYLSLAEEAQPAGERPQAADLGRAFGGIPGESADVLWKGATKDAPARDPGNPSGDGPVPLAP